MTNQREELKQIITRFSESGWDLIDAPAKAWLSVSDDSEIYNDVIAKLIKAVEQADKECGSCGCEYDPLYKRALEILQTA